VTGFTSGSLDLSHFVEEARRDVGEDAILGVDAKGRFVVLSQRGPQHGVVGRGSSPEEALDRAREAVAALNPYGWRP
jgi:hypothetical protein